MYFLPLNLKAWLRACYKGAKRTFLPPLETGTKNQKYLENVK